VYLVNQAKLLCEHTFLTQLRKWNASFMWNAHKQVEPDASKHKSCEKLWGKSCDASFI